MVECREIRRKYGGARYFFANPCQRIIASAEKLNFSWFLCKHRFRAAGDEVITNTRTCISYHPDSRVKIPKEEHAALYGELG